jgi:geranylgeranylglycerol-phosphate geranylgeranyltransferase
MTNLGGYGTRVLRKAKGVSDLLKPELPLAAGICVVAGELLALGHVPSIEVAVLGFLTGFFVSGSAMVSNDYFDLEVDRVNRPERPLPSGRVTVPELVVLTCALTLCGLVTSMLLSPLLLCVAVASWIIAFLYNWKYKESGFPGNLMVSYSVAVTFIFGGFAVGEPFSGVVWIFGAIAFTFDLGEEIANGAMDMEGDAKRSVKSLARSRGRNFALRSSSMLFAVVVALSFLPYAAGWLNKLYLAIVVPTDLMVSYLAFKLLRSQTQEEGRRRTRQLYLTMVLFVLAFMVSSLL